jgi:hypothetical protein
MSGPVRVEVRDGREGVAAFLGERPPRFRGGRP